MRKFKRELEMGLGWVWGLRDSCLTGLPSYTPQVQEPQKDSQGPWHHCITPAQESFRPQSTPSVKVCGPLALGTLTTGTEQKIWARGREQGVSRP
jgi:hypothetical protein